MCSMVSFSEAVFCKIGTARTIEWAGPGVVSGAGLFPAHSCSLVLSSASTEAIFVLQLFCCPRNWFQNKL